jgi:hypothetical protein
MTDIVEEMAAQIVAALGTQAGMLFSERNAHIAAQAAYTIVERRIGQLTEALLAANGMLRWYRREVPVEYQPVAGAMEETLRKVSASLEQRSDQ